MHLIDDHDYAYEDLLERLAEEEEALTEAEDNGVSPGQNFPVSLA